MNLWDKKKEDHKSPFEGVELPPDAEERLKKVDFKEDELKEHLKKFRIPITMSDLYTLLD